MSTTDWVLIGIEAAALIGIYVDMRLRIKSLEVKQENTDKIIDHDRDEFHKHEANNIASFDKFEKKIDSFHENLFKEINEIKKILMNKN